MKLDVGVEPDGAPNSLADRIAIFRDGIRAAARRAGRDPWSIQLVGVTKKQPRERVTAAISAGLTDIGENYVQEAASKFEALPPVRKHYIGRVQSNKAKAIVRTFDVVQSIDGIDAGRAIAKASRHLGKPVRTLLQINVSGVERFGLEPRNAAVVATELRESEGLAVDGIMAMGPNTDDRVAISRAFALASETLHAVGGDTLSIGMSGDWEEAIVCGSTMLRIGTAIFGARAPERSGDT